VLNEDTILSPDCISSLIEVAENSPQIGVVGPMVYHHDEPNVIQSAGGSIGPSWESAHLAENESDIGQFQQARKVDWISGCGIMVRRTLIEEVGMIDARYFYYWEETEWCLRAARAGWSIMHVPAARLWHKGVTRNYRPKPLVTYYSTRNRLLTLAKHKAPVVTWIRAWTQILRTLTSWTVKPRWRFMHEHRHAMWRGVVDFILQRWGGPVQL
jgi:GT2 family glycosyltransferase